MKNDILLKYRMLNAEEVNREIFKDFIRYQNVTKCWRKENGKWIIKDAPFVDDWTENDYQKLNKTVDTLKKAQETNYLYISYIKQQKKLQLSHWSSRC